MAVIDGVIIKGQCIVIPETLKQKALKQLHFNHLGTQKTKLLAHESVCWVGMYVDTENHIKIVLHTFIFSKPSQEKKACITTSLPNNGK